MGDHWHMPNPDPWIEGDPDERFRWDERDAPRSCGDALQDWHDREEQDMPEDICEWCFTPVSEITWSTPKLKAYLNRDGDREMLCSDCLADARDADKQKGRQPWE